MKVVWNTSPLCYLVLLELIDVLPELFPEILAPASVLAELSHQDSPAPVKEWASKPPSWVLIRSVDVEPPPELAHLHKGETDVIVLAKAMEADWVVLDDKQARETASDMGLHVIGLLGILDLAAEKDLVDLPTAFDRLRETTFYVSPRLLEKLLSKPRNHQVPP